MSSPARLRSLRLVGFKSFAEKTELEFGAGVSVIVGPNGSGKSNLADALRWAMGEQGRSLRIRRAEDVIFAGSERRHGIGMADVTLVLDNQDGLLPVDFGEVSLGRRLYRSGENEYLLNRQRVRLRDIVDLLETASLADNAFLFIGQGMVDQALALRPEERRPLFEEVAGVRRHDRRRRLAEQQLGEAESNLARVHDLLGELRPQARRLGQQVEQQRARSSAAGELAQALVAAAGARWSAAASAAREAGRVLDGARRAADVELAGLGAAEDLVVQLEARLVQERAAEDELRAALEALRGAQTDARLRLVRVEGAVDGLEREQRRLEGELATLEARTTEGRRVLSAPVPEPDLEAQEELRGAELRLAEAQGELARLRAAAQAAGERDAALRRAEAARAADLEAARRRAAQATRRLAEQDARHAAAVETERRAAGRRAETEGTLQKVVQEEAAAEAAVAGSRDALEAAEGRQRQIAERLAGASAEAAASRSRLDAVEDELRTAGAGEIVAAAVRLGGQRIADGLEVAPALRGAVAAALGAALRAPALPTAALPELGEVRGVVVLRDAAASGPEILASALERARAAGGGPLVEAVRRDPAGVATRLLGAALWVPDLPTALSLRATLPPGTVVATPGGDLVSADGVVAIGAADPYLDRRSERERLAAALATQLRDLEARQAEHASARHALEAARVRADDARRAVQQARAARRAAEEADRAAARAADAASRDLAWEAAQLERLRGEAERAADGVRLLEAGQPGLWDRSGGAPSGDAPSGDAAGTGAGAAAPGSAGDALAAWEQRVRELQRARDEVARRAEATGLARQRALDERSRAEGALDLHDARIGEIGTALAELAGSREGAAGERAAVAAELAGLDEREAALRVDLERLGAGAAGGRASLEAAERDAALRRERLRRAEEGVRAAEIAELEARMARDALREQVLVELAALGPVGLAALRAAGAPERIAGEPAEAAPAAARGVPGSADGSRPAPTEGAAGISTDDLRPSGEPLDEDELAPALEAALAQAAARWERATAVEPAPSPGRLAALRRRVHELGAGNPFAIQEYEEVAGRLETLERQRADLEEAIATTRKLIADLSEQINRQFRATFEALEGAFERRFARLFGGGFARLSLTEPDDLQATGVDIVAQPPGKKRQPLAMLSGGERALTAVALLFAMLEVRPVPFCVLDEVDAALDEANVGRFAEALRELAATTQIIVITHNRGTIENGDALYGITLGADAVSRVVSLRLEEAASLAEAAAGDSRLEAGRSA